MCATGLPADTSLFLLKAKTSKLLCHCFTSYDIYFVGRLVVEYPPSGGAISSHRFTTVKLLRYVSVSDYIIMGCEMVFIAYVIYYLIEELIEVRDYSFVFLIDVITSSSLKT